MRFFYDCMIWGKDQESWTMTKAQGSMPGPGFKWCSPGFGLQKHAHMFMITLAPAEIQWMSMRFCDLDMIASSWLVEQRALGPWLEPRAQGSGLIAHGSVAMGQGHLARGQSADDREPRVRVHGLFFSRLWISNLGSKNIAICIWIQWN